MPLDRGGGEDIQDLQLGCSNTTQQNRMVLGRGHPIKIMHYEYARKFYHSKFSFIMQEYLRFLALIDIPWVPEKAGPPQYQQIWSYMKMCFKQSYLLDISNCHNVFPAII